MGFWEGLKEAFRNGYRSGRDGAPSSSEQLATPLDRIRKHIPREQITIGVVLLIFGIFGYQVSPKLAVLLLGLGVLLFTWNARVSPLLRIFFYVQYQEQIVDQALMLMSQLDPGNQVFLVGTTNHIEDIDPRILRGGRFTEKIELEAPDDAGYLRLFEKYLDGVPLAEGFRAEDLMHGLRGISPADLEAVVNTAKRMAFGRRAEPGVMEIPPLIQEDFDKALKRNRPIGAL